MGIYDFFSKKKLAAGSVVKRDEPEAEYATRLCFVLCRTAEPRPISDAADVVAQVFGEGYSVDVAEGTSLLLFAANSMSDCSRLCRCLFRIAKRNKMPIATSFGPTDEMRWPSIGHTSSSQTLVQAIRRPFSRQFRCRASRWLR